MSAKMYNVTVGDTTKTVSIDYNSETGIYTITIDGVSYICTGSKISSSGTTKTYNVEVDGIANTVAINKNADESYNVTLNGVLYTNCTEEEYVPPVEEPVLTLDGTNYILTGDTSGISVSKDESTNVVVATISAAGNYTITGSGVNDIIRVNDGVAGVNITLSSLVIDNTNYATVSGQDSSIIDLGNSTDVNISILNSNTISGANSFAVAPASIISGNNVDLDVNGSGLINISDTMPANTDFSSVLPSNIINDPNGNISFNSATINASANGSFLNATQSTVVFNGSNINVTYSGKDAISVPDGSINFDSGNINISDVHGDAINADKVSSLTTGDITIDGSTITILDAYRNGISAENVNIESGSVSISTKFDTASTQYYAAGSDVPDKNTIEESGAVKTTRINVDTGEHYAIKAGTEGCTYSFLEIDPSDTDHETGVEYTTDASGELNIAGGSVTVNTSGVGLTANIVSNENYEACDNGVFVIGAPSNAIRSFNNIEISGGSVNADASDSAIVVDGDVNISGGIVDISSAYSGIIGDSVTIDNSIDENGSVYINADDDGIKAFSKTVKYIYDNSINLNENYSKIETTVAGENDVNIDGTVVNIHINSEIDKSIELNNGEEAPVNVVYKATGDGVNAKGSIVIDSGSVTVYGQSAGDKIPFNAENEFGYNNGTILVTGAAENVPTDGTGCYISKAGITFNADDTIQIKTADDEPEVLYDGTLPYNGAFIMYGSENIVNGNDYVISIGTNNYTVTATAAS